VVIALLSWDGTVKTATRPDEKEKNESHLENGRKSAEKF